MSNFVNVTSDTRMVRYGLQVPDEFDENYDQPGIWERQSKKSAKAADAAEEES
jgi:hypothetical protein